MADKTKTETFAARTFVYNGAELEDPDMGMDEKEVKKLYESAYPELTTATMVVSFEDRAGVRTKVVTFEKAAGTKG